MNPKRMQSPVRVWALILFLFCWTIGPLQGQSGRESGTGEGPRHSAARSFEWPDAAQVRRVLSLQDYNTRVVFAGTSALGGAGGLVGAFLLLRKRSLLSDTVSHCTLPGIAMAFLLGERFGISGRSLPWLLFGAAVTGILGMLTVAWIRARSRVKDDAALAIVLSVFFGFGVALMVIIQQLPTGNSAGLGHYIYGKAASMTAGDARLILYSSLVVALVCGVFFKELKLLCFDADYARTQGWPAFGLDVLLMGLVVCVTVIGLQAVGLLLVVALMIIPAAAARFWSDRLGVTVILAAFLGALSGLVGVTASALLPRLPAGAVIVLAAVLWFAISMIFGRRRGVLIRWLEQRDVSRRVARQHLLRAVYEWCEAPGNSEQANLDQPVPVEPLRKSNHWTARQMRRLLRQGCAENLIDWSAGAPSLHLNARGKLEARRVTRNHRLWETYLLHYADVAPQHIHHNADQIEHVIDPNVVNELEELLAGRGSGSLVPQNPERR